MNLSKIVFYMTKSAGLHKEARGGGGSAEHRAQLSRDRDRERARRRAAMSRPAPAPAPAPAPKPALEMGGFMGDDGNRYDDMGMPITADGKFLDEQPLKLPSRDPAVVFKDFKRYMMDPARRPTMSWKEPLEAQPPAPAPAPAPAPTPKPAQAQPSIGSRRPQILSPRRISYRPSWLGKVKMD